MVVMRYDDFAWSGAGWRLCMSMAFEQQEVQSQYDHSPKKIPKQQRMEGHCIAEKQTLPIALRLAVTYLTTTTFLIPSSSPTSKIIVHSIDHLHPI